MCNTRTITYSCSHTIPFRLSTCRGIYTYKTRKHPSGELPSCRSGPLLTFTSTQPCGACAKTTAEKTLDENITALRTKLTPSDWLSEDPDELVTAEAEYESEKWRLTGMFPELARMKKDVRPEKGPRATRSGTLLRQEVKAEDVVLGKMDSRNAITGNWDDEAWGDEWTDLSEEIAEDYGGTVPAFVDLGMSCFEEGVGDAGEGEELEDLSREAENADGEVFSVMDWGTATSGVLESVDVWDPEKQVDKVEVGEEDARPVDKGQVGEENVKPIDNQKPEDGPLSRSVALVPKENQAPVIRRKSKHQDMRTTGKAQQHTVSDFGRFKPFFMEISVSI